MKCADDDRMFEFTEPGVDRANADRVSIDLERGVVSVTTFENGEAVQHEAKSMQEWAQEFGFTKRNRVGRNQPCPCGSGKKYKKCHGL